MCNDNCHVDMPVFDTYPLPAWLTNGSMLVLNCSAIGQPQPNITWLLNFEALNVTDCDDDDLIGAMLCSNGSLIIRSVDFSDSGFYTCVADNGFSVNQVSVSVDVGQAPTIINGILT